MVQEVSTRYLYCSSAQSNFIPSSLIKSLKEARTNVIKVKPISAVALSNIDNIYAYDVVITLFFNCVGRTTNTLFGALLDICKKIDEGSKKSASPTHFQQVLTFINFGKANIDGILGKLESNKGADSSEFNSDLEAQYELEERQKILEEQYEKLQDRLKKLSENFQNLILNSYKNTFFYDAIEKTLSKQSLKQFREVTATFYPFLHYQLSGDQHALMGMTVAKLLTRHHVLSPKFVKSSKTIKWFVRTVPAEEIIDDTSDFSVKAREALDEAEVDDEVKDFLPKCRKLFNAEVHIYLDESDSSKAIINEILHKNLDDKGIIQANGAVAKEAGDVLYSDSHQSLLNRIPDRDIEAYKFLTNGDFDDAIQRQVGKDILRNIQDEIVRYVSSSDWGSDKHGFDDVDTINHDIIYIARAMLSAPCTVEAGLEKSVFEMTSAFGGEMFGFVGSRNMDQYVVIATPSSIRITTSEYLKKGQEYIPLKTLFLLITINLLILQKLDPKVGGETRDRKQEEKAVYLIDELLSSDNSLTASHGTEQLKKYIRELYSDEQEGLLAVAKPFRYRSGNLVEEQVYHTECALASRLNSLGGRAAFSPRTTHKNLLGEESSALNQEFRTSD